MTGGTVVVLGPTGRNFAAGMSGGVAFLYNPVLRRINTEMVDVDLLDDGDRALLLTLIARHRRETGSTVAAGLLADWDSEQSSFVKIMPRDYKRVLAAMRKAEEDGLPAEDLIMSSSRV